MLSWKCFPLWGEVFLVSFVPNSLIYLYKVYFQHTGCLKNGKFLKWAKIEINDFNQYICSPEKIFLYEAGLFGFLCPKYIYLPTHSVFFAYRLQGVLKIGKCHEMGWKLRYMTSMNIVALPKNFSFMRWCLFGASVPNT